jgi:hypothetical protein
LGFAAEFCGQSFLPGSEPSSRVENISSLYDDTEVRRAVRPGGTPCAR